MLPFSQRWTAWPAPRASLPKGPRPEPRRGRGFTRPLASSPRRPGKMERHGRRRLRGRHPRGPTTPGVARPDTLTIPVGVGRRALVVANLGLTAEASAATTWASSGVARALDTWDGPGLVVVAGNLFDLSGEPDPASAASAALAAHPRLAQALEPSRAATTGASSPSPGAPTPRSGAEASPVLARLGVRDRRRRPTCTWPRRRGTVSCASRRKCRARRRRRWRPRAGRRRHRARRIHPHPQRRRRVAGRPRPAGRPGQHTALPHLAPPLPPLRPLRRGGCSSPSPSPSPCGLPFVSAGLDHLVFGQPTPSRAIEPRPRRPVGGHDCSSPPLVSRRRARHPRRRARLRGPPSVADPGRRRARRPLRGVAGPVVGVHRQRRRARRRRGTSAARGTPAS